MSRALAGVATSACSYALSRLLTSSLSFQNSVDERVVQKRDRNRVFACLFYPLINCLSNCTCATVAVK